jgi:hypothetical protein
LGHAKDLEVDILRRMPAQQVADPAAYDERATARLADGDGNLADQPRRFYTAHESIIVWW